MSIFIKYDKNPVIKNSGIKDFRDPKVVWDDDSKQWIMVLDMENHILDCMDMWMRIMVDALTHENLDMEELL